MLFAMLFDVVIVSILVFWVFPKILRRVVIHVKRRSHDINQALNAEPEEKKPQ